MAVIPMREMLEAGVHFGHQTKRWNPKMRPYIYGARNKIYIIDLQQTARLFDEAYRFVVERVGEGESILFVGTKRQAQTVIREAAERCGGFTVTNRWLGGTLTNFRTISRSVDRLKKLELMKEKNDYADLTKKEILKLEKERIKLERYLGGIKSMGRLPGAVFIVDPGKEKIAVAEAAKLGVPIVALVDTNCDPEKIDFVIPANDDALRSIELFVNKVADAVVEGKRLNEERTRARVDRLQKEDQKSEAKPEATTSDRYDPEALSREAQVAVDTKRSLRKKSLAELSEQDGGVEATADEGAQPAEEPTPDKD